jgi:sialic acid synthase SpsE
MIKLISEIGSNHNNDFNRCLTLIDQAKEYGFNGIKMQLFKADKLTKNKTLQADYKKQELDIEWIPAISEYCKKVNMLFGCTPFYLEAINELKDYVDFFKISSFDILRLDLIKKCIETKKDVYISCGLASNENIENIIDLILQYGSAESNYYFMHCVSKYPTNVEESCMKRITEIFLLLLKYKRKNIFVGYSDHTKDVDVIRESFNLMTQVIELHFDLDDKLGSESKYGHCWTPKDMTELYNKMNKINNMLNSKFILTDEQLKLRADSKTGYRG